MALFSCFPYSKACKCPKTFIFFLFFGLFRSFRTVMRTLKIQKFEFSTVLAKNWHFDKKVSLRKAFFGKSCYQRSFWGDLTRKKCKEIFKNKEIRQNLKKNWNFEQKSGVKFWWKPQDISSCHKKVPINHILFWKCIIIAT